MRIDDARRHVERGVRDAPHPDTPVVIRHVLEEPLNRVVRVSAFVDVFGPRLLRDVRAHVDEIALGHPFSAHVLIDEDVALVGEPRRRPKQILVGVEPVWGDGVRRTTEQDRVGLRGVLRRIDGREELHAVAHGDHDFALRVVGLDVLRQLTGLLLCLLRRRRSRRGPIEKDADRYNGRPECAPANIFSHAHNRYPTAGGEK
jgi:hypothetical protein